ncbi:hypothetical protein C2W59_00239 [Bacillus pumilus]|uniref:DUF7003 family protein n=1 Tax=Bacillus pumilus TaxID=1408 RepID=UPI000DC4DB93|nr:hypothetical protein [Bacillus pumilus]RAP25277.1 hypothetical protein C2W59_00239 [Bacillus pumilus]
MNQIDNVLSILDESFLNKEFPLLDNGNFDFAKGKLSLFVGKGNWLITIQLFGLSNLGPAIDFFAIGHELNNGSTHFLLDELFDFVDHHHEIIDDNEIEPGFTEQPLRIKLDGDYFNVQIPESCRANITEENEWITLLREMAKHRDLLDGLWMTDQEQFDIVQHVYDKPLYTTESWFHPETDGQLPSQSPFFQSVAKSLIYQDPTCIVNINTNTDWRLWSDFDSVEYF